MRAPLLLTAAVAAVALGCSSGALQSVHGQLVVDTTPIAFGDQPVLTPVQKSLVLTNEGRGPLTFSQVALTMAQPAGSTAFTPADFHLSTLASGGTSTIVITFSAPAMGPYSATLVIASNDPSRPNVQIPVTGTATTAAVAVTSTTCLDFGRVPEGQTSIMAVTVTSAGTAPLLINNLSLASGSNPAFGPVGSWNTNPPVQLAAPQAGQPNAGVDISVAFDPTPQTVTASDEQATGTLNIGTNDPAQQTIPICLTGSMNLAPIAIATGPTVVAPGTLVTLDGTMSYDPDGDDPLTYDWALLSAPAGSTVAIDATTATTTFTPDLAGSYEISLTVFDSLGLQSIPARVTVIAASSQNLEVELVWDEPTVDLDLHLRPFDGGTMPAALYGPEDCYGFQPNLTWSDMQGTAADSGDVLSGYGPETIDVTDLGPGPYQYRASVVYVTANGAASTAVNATVRFYLYGALVGEATQQMTMPGDEADDYKGEVWDAANITWPTGAIVAPPPGGSQ